MASSGLDVRDCHLYGDYYACVVDDVRTDDPLEKVEIDVLVFEREDPVTFSFSLTDHEMRRAFGQFIYEHGLNWEEDIHRLPGRRVLARPIDPANPKGDWEICSREDTPSEWILRDDPFSTRPYRSATG